MSELAADATPDLGTSMASGRDRHSVLTRWWFGVSGLCRVGYVIIGFVLALAILGDRVVPYDPYAIDVMNQLQGPSREHLFGTDRFGRDVFSRVLYGSRISMSIALSSVAMALAVGATLGVMAGYFGRTFDLALSRVMDVLLSFPSLLLAITIAGILGPGIQNGIAAITVVYIPFFFRVARAPVLSERERDYVLAAQSVGTSDSQILRRHVLPNVTAPILIQTAVTLSYALLTEASLAYLGLGAQPPDPSWGVILNEGRSFIELAPWISIFPGLAIMIVVFGFNLVGDGLRDALDPRQRGRRRRSKGA
jgi:peptide/nickel transport system permease protein